MGTGLIYAAIVAAWAAYLVPLWLRRHDEAAASRSVDKFSAAMRVLARRKPPAYAMPADEDPADQLPRRPVLGPPPRSSSTRPPAGLSAATRRRRVLVFLVAALTVVTVLAVLTVVPWWSVLIPSGVVVLFLVVSASAARAERLAAARVPRRPHAPVRRSSRVTASYAHGSPIAQPGIDDEPTVVVRRPSAEPAPEPVAEEPAASDELWDPVEVPLPTYVTKARAPYTVRTVDLGAPGTWTSGRLPEAELLSRTPMSAAELIETVQAPPPVEEEELEHRRAVGD